VDSSVVRISGFQPDDLGSNPSPRILKMEQEEQKNKFAKFHDRHYKLLLLIPAAILLFSFIFIYSFYQQNNDFFHKDISLTGGSDNNKHKI
jgi:hypothetical protein